MDFTDDELIVLYDAGETNVILDAAISEIAPVQRRLKGSGWACTGDDAHQQTALAILEGLAARAWKPELGAFTTWVRDVIERELRNFANARHNLGIGSRRQREEYKSLSIFSLNELVKPDVYDEEGADDEAETRQDTLTYDGDAEVIPEGLDEPASVLEQQGHSRAARAILTLLKPRDRDTLISLYMDEKTLETEAAAEKVSHVAVIKRRDRALKAGYNSAKTWEEGDTRATDARGYLVFGTRGPRERRVYGSRPPEGFYRGANSVRAGRRYWKDNLSNLHSNWAWGKTEAARHNPVTVILVNGSAP